MPYRIDTLFHISYSSHMTDEETRAKEAAEAKINALSKNFDEDADDSGDEPDEESPDSNPDSVLDSEEEPGSESDDSDPEEDDSEEELEDSDSDDPDFGFRDTPTHVQNFVAKLERMSPEERAEKVKSLDPKRNAREIEAAKGKYPDIFDEPERFSVSKEDWEKVNEKLSKLEKLEKADEILKTYDALVSKQPKLESELSDRMLKEKYGDRFEDVKSDPKFKDAMERLSKLDLVERLEQASMHSPVARQILVAKEAQQQNKLQALKKRKKSSQGKSKTDPKHPVYTAEGIEERFGEALASL